MAPLTGAVLAAALVLLTSGAVKLVHPAALATTLAGLGVTRFARPLARGVGLAEVAVGGWLCASGSVAAAVTAGGLYAGFTAFLIVGLRAPERIRTCGCTTGLDDPPTWQHAVLTAGFSVVCWTAAATGGITPVTRMPAVTDPLTAATVLGYAVCGAALAWAVMALLPKVRPKAQGSVR